MIDRHGWSDGRVKAEFTIEPFVDGAPGPHVTAGLDAVRAAGLSADDRAVRHLGRG